MGAPFLQPGDSGNWVTYLQEALRLTGVDPVPEVTGDYDSATAASVRAFRGTAGLAEGDTTDDGVWAAVLTPGIVAQLGADSAGAAAADDFSYVTLLFGCPVEVERDMYEFDIQAGAWADVPGGTFEMKVWVMYADVSYEDNGTMPLHHDIPAGQTYRIRQIIDLQRVVAEGEQITMLWDFQGKTNERLRASFTKGARANWTVNDCSIDFV